MSVSATWIEDGFTVPFEIPAVPTMHEGLKGTFRPAPDVTRFTYRRVLERNCGGSLKAEMKAAEDEQQLVIDTLVK